MTTVTLAEAQARLPELLEALQPGESLSITKDALPIARVEKQLLPTRQPRQSGTAIGKLTIVADDDEHLEHFKAYMP